MANEQSVVATRSVKIAGVTIGGIQQTLSVDGGFSIQKAVPNGSTNARFDVGSIPTANVKAIAMVCSVAATVKTNSTGLPDETLTLVANTELIWLTGDPSAGKFITHDLLTLYVTIPGAVDGIFKFGAAVDTTPGLSG